MPLHHADRHTAGKHDDIYALAPSDRRLSKYRIPDEPADPSSVYNLIRDELLLDGNSRQNLATFCTTWVEPEVLELMDDAFDKNIVDKDEYPQTRRDREPLRAHDRRSVARAAVMDTVGCSTTGSSEAAMLGGLALKWRWRKARQARVCRPTSPNLVCGPVQVCWQKFARYFDVELREVPLEGQAHVLRPEDLQQYCDENTIGVVATLGVTFTGAYEPVAAMARALDQIERRTGFDIPIHVDGASGGFVAPFIQPELEWDFQIERVKSINASGHKFGLAPLGVGWIVWRAKEDLPEELIFNVDYLGGNMPTFALNFSRPGGEIIAQYYNFLRLGRGGYARIHQACADTARWLARRAGEAGPAEDHLQRRRRAALRLLPADTRASSTASRSTTSPTGCASAAGRSRHTRCRPTVRTRWCSASWCVTASAATWRICCSRRSSARWTICAPTPSRSQRRDRASATTDEAAWSVSASA